MKKIVTLIIFAALSVSILHAEIVPTSNGAKITLGDITTEFIVYSPDVVRVIKYVGERPALPACRVLKVKKGEPATRDMERHEGNHKYKVDTGSFSAALNEKDGNVSFWTPDEALILAEQHKTASLVPDTKGTYTASQDFQFGRASVEQIYCPAAKKNATTNIKGRKVDFGNALPQSRIATEKGWELIWNVPGQGNFDSTPDREGKKPGDVTFISTGAPFIDYFFVNPSR